MRQRLLRFHEDDIVSAARRLRSRLVDVETCRKLLDAEISRTAAAGTTVAHIADITQLSRESVYQALRRAEAREP